MSCLKCGKDTEEKQVFCEECRSGMEKHPVKPGTPMHLQFRETKTQGKKTHRRKEQDPKEAVRQQRKMIRWLTVTVAVMTLVICFLAGLLIHALEEAPTDGNIGRNYTTDTTQQSGS